MFSYGKTAGHAIAVMSYLAEIYASGQGRATSSDIAKARGISKPLAAKVLTTLSQVGLVGGAPGPGGGYFLARPPDGISLLDVVRPFERLDETVACPFGPNYCGHNSPCPLHETLASMRQQSLDFLARTALGLFQK